MLLFFLICGCFAYYQSKNINLKSTRNYLFSFSVGNGGVLDISSATPEHSNRVELGVCERGRDYSIMPTATDKEKCEKLKSLCHIYSFDDKSIHLLNSSMYDFALLACNTTFPFNFQYTIHIKNGKSELPMSHIYSPHLFLLLTALYSIIASIYMAYCFCYKTKIKQIHRILVILQVVFILRCAFESVYYKDYSVTGKPSQFLFLVSALLHGISDYAPLVLCSIVTLGYSVVFSHLFRQQTQPFVIILLVYLFISFGSHIFKDIRLMVSLIGLFFILPITGRFVAINRHFITMNILSDEIPIESVDVLKKKTQIIQLSYFLVFFRLIACTLYDFTQEVSLSNSPYISTWVFESVLIFASTFMLFLLRPREGVFRHIHLDTLVEIRHQPPPLRPRKVMKDVKEKIDREEIVFFTYATSLNLTNQENAPVGIGYASVN